MDTLTLTQKQAQFEEFFMIAHKLKVNIRPIDAATELPLEEEFEEAMPYAFRIAGEMASIEAKALRPLRHLSDHAEELAAYLNHQAKKIDLMMSYILHSEDNAALRYLTVKFGGGGIIVDSDQALTVGDHAEVKLFLNEEAAAVYCFGEVIACQQEQGRYHIAFIFTRIREQDQELLVRASLHQQTLQLRKRKQEQQGG